MLSDEAILRHQFLKDVPLADSVHLHSDLAFTFPVILRERCLVFKSERTGRSRCYVMQSESRFERVFDNGEASWTCDFAQLSFLNDYHFNNDACGGALATA